jgi:serine/threonine protein kinase/tetratricopeptide (TPR) repeat protein
MIGERILHYRIVDLLGEGGMGAVFKAEDLTLNRPAAIKILPHELTRNEEAKDRFIHEARAASALDHPNICTIYEFGQTSDGRLFLAMAYYEGETLDKMIQREVFTLDEILAVIIQIAEGLSKAHGRGLVHRDIKPANIIYTRDRQIKILDFGLAKLVDTAGTETENERSGTIYYMSPEQVQGQVVDERSDIWSLGVVFYELLTGSCPFAGNFRQSVIYSILNEQPPDLNTFDPEYPPELQNILNRALSKRADQRYHHILDMLQDLEQLRRMLSGKNLTIQDEKSRGPGWKMILSAVAILAAAVVLSLWLFLPVKTPPSNSITVMPFTDRQTGYLGRGLARDLLTCLGNKEGLMVVIPSSSDSGAAAEQVSRNLNVRYILNGGIEEKNRRLKINARLISMPGQRVLWSENYESPWTHIKTVENGIASRVAQVLKMKESSDVNGKTESWIDPQAYEYYLKGREYYYRYREKDNETAISLFHKSLGFDSLYAPARAGLADAFAQKTLRFGDQDRWLDSAGVAARRAIRTDPRCAEAYKALAMVAYTRSHFDDAFSLNRQALQQDPSYSPAMANLGWICFNLGKLDSAKYWLDRALLVNPTNPAITMGYALSCLSLSEYDEARYYAAKTLDLDPGYQPSPEGLVAMIDLLTGGPVLARTNVLNYLEKNSGGSVLYFIAGDLAVRTGNPREALEFYRKVLEQNPQAWQPFTGINITTALGYILFKTGHTEEADQLFTESMKMDRSNLEHGNEWWGVPYDLAAIHAIQGNDSVAVEFLQKAVLDGFTLRKWLETDPLFEQLRDNRQFELLVENQGGTYSHRTPD